MPFTIRIRILKFFTLITNLSEDLNALSVNSQVLVFQCEDEEEEKEQS